MEVLYVYDHCPFCVKARMIFGLKNRPYTLTYLLNDDEETPIKMIGQKMLPILQEGEHYMAESMDIVRKIDQKDQQPVLTGGNSSAIAAWIEQADKIVYPLVIPRYARASSLPEFVTAEARAYFTQKKEAIFGSFSLLLAETGTLVERINKHLEALEPLIQSPDACNGCLSEDDIHLFPVLRGLSIVEGVIYPLAVDAYRQQMSKASGIPLLGIS